jgi:hypothetical protein
MRRRTGRLIEKKGDEAKEVKMREQTKKIAKSNVLGIS